MAFHSLNVWGLHMVLPKYFSCWCELLLTASVSDDLIIYKIYSEAEHLDHNSHSMHINIRASDNTCVCVQIQ